MESKSTVRLHIVNKQHYRTLKSLYCAHLARYFNLSNIPARKLSELFAKFSGYGSSNALMASVGVSPENALSYGKEWSWMFGDSAHDIAFANEMLFQQYVSHFADEYGMPLRETKAKARFCGLYGVSSMDDILPMVSAFSSVKAYVVALSINVSVQKDQILNGGLGIINVDSSSRMAYQVPSLITPTTAVCFDLSEILASEGGVFYSLFSKLVETSNYAELYAEIKLWVSMVGVHFVGEDGVRHFVTEDCRYKHECVSGNHWEVVIHPSSGMVTEKHLATALRQVNATWDDVDARGKYNVDSLQDEVLNLGALGGDCSTVSYSSTYRGKAAVLLD